jgi:hypothetical protein
VFVSPYHCLCLTVSGDVSSSVSSPVGGLTIEITQFTLVFGQFAFPVTRLMSGPVSLRQTVSGSRRPAHRGDPDRTIERSEVKTSMMSGPRDESAAIVSAASLRVSSGVHIWMSGVITSRTLIRSLSLADLPLALTSIAADRSHVLFASNATTRSSLLTEIRPTRHFVARQAQLLGTKNLATPC